MDPRLLRLLQPRAALTCARSAPSSRASFPKIAARLGMDGIEVADPYVERLLEGFAFLAARVQLKLDAEFPRFIAAPARVGLPQLPRADAVDAGRAHGHRPGRPEPGRTASRCRAARRCIAELARGQDTRCEFRTAHEVTLWPIELAGAQYFSTRADLPLAALPQAHGTRGGMRIRLRSRRRPARSTSSASTAARSTSRRPTTSPSACTNCCSARPLGTLVRAGARDAAPAAQRMARRRERRSRSASATTRRCCP